MTGRKSSLLRPSHKQFNPNFKRRGFLKALGASATLVPFIPILPSSAEDSNFPRRLVLLFSPNGTIHENWVPQGGETDFTLSTILQPLEAFRDQIVVIDGLESIRDGAGDGHQQGIGSLWTGSKLSSSEAAWAQHMSIDQRVANEVGGETPYKSLEFGLRCGDYADVWARMCYEGPNAPIAPEESPANMFDRLFAGLNVDSAQLERIRAERRSVIDFVQDDLDRVQRQVAGADRIKIEAHLDAMRAVEKRNEAAASACQIPEQDFGDDDYPIQSRQMIDQLVMSLACDQTRVASLQWSRAVGGTVFSWLGIDRGHHDISHDGDNSAYMVDSITKINTWYAGEMAYMLQRMSEIPEGNGTLLDHTMIVWGNELGRGNSHTEYPIPFVLAGGGNGALQTGRFLQYDKVPHNRLLVSIGQAMGLDLDTFGDKDPGTGGLPGLS